MVSVDGCVRLPTVIRVLHGASIDFKASMSANINKISTDSCRDLPRGYGALVRLRH